MAKRSPPNMRLVLSTPGDPEDQAVSPIRWDNGSPVFRVSADRGFRANGTSRLEQTNPARWLSFLSGGISRKLTDLIEGELVSFAKYGVDFRDITIEYEPLREPDPGDLATIRSEIHFRGQNVRSIEIHVRAEDDDFECETAVGKPDEGARR